MLWLKVSEWADECRVERNRCETTLRELWNFVYEVDQKVRQKEKG